MNESLATNTASGLQDSSAASFVTKKPSPSPQRIDVELAESTVGNPGLEDCVLEAIRAWKIPAVPKSKAVVTVAWTFSPTGGLQLLGQKRFNTLSAMRGDTGTADTVRGKASPKPAPAKKKAISKAELDLIDTGNGGLGTEPGKAVEPEAAEVKKPAEKK